MHAVLRKTVLWGALAVAFTGAEGCAVPPAAPLSAQDPARTVDAERLLRDLSVLAHDSMQGRQAGTPGAERARRFLVAELERMGVPAPAEGRLAEFPVRGASGSITGVNVLGLVQGTEHPSRYVVVSAHYDHLGVLNGQIYNGADDNASGTAALLTMADLFTRAPARHSLLFVAFDAEEVGLRGARAFLDDPPVPRDSILLNVNLDMVSRNDENELYAAGAYHYPILEGYLEEVAARSDVSLLLGHDSPDLPGGDDWTEASDHGPFHQAGIPFVYFGVEDHEAYHQPSDDYEGITSEFYVDAVTTIVDFLESIDRQGSLLESLAEGAAVAP